MNDSTILVQNFFSQAFVVVIITLYILCQHPISDFPAVDGFVHVKPEFVFNLPGENAQPAFAFVPFIVVVKFLNLIVKHIPADGQVPETVFDLFTQAGADSIIPLMDRGCGVNDIEFFGGSFFRGCKRKIINGSHTKQCECGLLIDPVRYFILEIPIVWTNGQVNGFEQQLQVGATG